MELHRSYRYDRKLSLVGIIYGGVAFIAGSGLALITGHAGWLALWCSGVFFFFIGLCLFLFSFRPFRISISDSGLTVRSEGHRFQGSWDLVDAIYVEPSLDPGPPLRERHFLVLWVADHVPMRKRAAFPFGAKRKGHALIEIVNLKESQEEVAAILRRYAGEKFRSLSWA